MHLPENWQDVLKLSLNPLPTSTWDLLKTSFDLFMPKRRLFDVCWYRQDVCAVWTDNQRARSNIPVLGIWLSALPDCNTLLVFKIVLRKGHLIFWTLFPCFSNFGQNYFETPSIQCLSLEKPRSAPYENLIRPKSTKAYEQSLIHISQLFRYEMCFQIDGHI